MRVVPIEGEARKSLRHYLEIRPRGGDELWKNADGQRLTARGIQMVIKHLKKRAGINGGGGPHRFRHYFATHCLDNVMDLNTLRLLLGHAMLAMVLRYSLYASASRALSQHNQFDPLDRLVRGDINSRRLHNGRQEELQNG